MEMVTYSKLASRAIITLSKQQPERITGQELQYLQHDSSLHCDEIWQKISSGITAPHVPDHSDVLNSATWESLSLEGFWDILNASKWNQTFRWLESEFDPPVFLSRIPSIQAPLGTAREQFIQTLNTASNLLVQLEQIDANRQILPNQQYYQMQMLIQCMPI